MTTRNNSHNKDVKFTFTDIVLMLYLDGMPRHQGHDEADYDNQTLRQSALEVFALGCAVGSQHPQLILSILEQTHPGQSLKIIEDCSGTLLEDVLSAKNNSIPLEPSLFLMPLLAQFAEEPHIPEKVAGNVLGISFEYGCIFSHIDRRAARIVRNHYNRKQITLNTHPGSLNDPGPVVGLGSQEPLQKIAEELVAAYLHDVGFDVAT